MLLSLVPESCFSPPPFFGVFVASVVAILPSVHLSGCVCSLLSGGHHGFIVVLGVVLCSASQSPALSSLFAPSAGPRQASSSSFIQLSPSTGRIWRFLILLCLSGDLVIQLSSRSFFLSFQPALRCYFHFFVSIVSWPLMTVGCHQSSVRRCSGRCRLCPVVVVCRLSVGCCRHCFICFFIFLVFRLSSCFSSQRHHALFYLFSFAIRFEPCVFAAYHSSTLSPKGGSA